MDRSRPRGRSKSAFGTLLVLGVVALPTFAQADIYRYVDKDGVIHFTSRKGSSKATLYARDKAGRPTAWRASRPPSDRDIARYSRYDAYIRQAAAIYQIPEQLVRAVIKVESDYDPNAVSSAGARGLMQLMPATAQRLQVHDIDDPRENIFGGVRFLRILANTFNGDLALTVAAYNAGEDAVIRHRGIPPFSETQRYVAKVTHFYGRYRSIPDVVEASVGKSL